MVIHTRTDNVYIIGYVNFHFCFVLYAVITITGKILRYTVRYFVVAVLSQEV